VRASPLFATTRGAIRFARRLPRPLGAALPLVLVALAGRALAQDVSSAAAVPRAPSFLVVLVDDQAKNSFTRSYMPITFRQIVDHGTTFTNGLAAPPLCCPDRAGIITGQYPHNHGVFANRPGYPDLRDPDNTLPVWLRRAGYRTGLVGRFLNRYRGLEPAPGFNRWFGYKGAGAYYDYDVSDQGVLRHYGHERSDYSTDVLTRAATRFLDRSAASPKPFFLWLTYNAPHPARQPDPGPCAESDPTAPGKAAFRAERDIPLHRSPSFNERRISDKPRKIRRLDRLHASDIRTIERRWHCTLAAMREVDSGVGRLMNSLRQNRELAHTIVIYLSDNGFFFGEHRIPFGKGFVYEPALEVPYVVRMPNAYTSSTPPARNHMAVTNQDIAPTLLDYAGRFHPGVRPCAGPGGCRRMDGRSLAPLLGGGGTWPADRGVLVELDSRVTSQRTKVNPECNCAYVAIRTQRYLLSELSTGERELYDLVRDPYQLKNVIKSPGYAVIREILDGRLDRLRHCSGVEGRESPGDAPFCE
jgi:N-acetylglucosamine-6-sulfatase